MYSSMCFRYQGLALTGIDKYPVGTDSYAKIDSPIFGIHRQQCQTYCALLSQCFEPLKDTRNEIDFHGDIQTLYIPVCYAATSCIGNQMTDTDGFIAFSYNYLSDLQFVEALADELLKHGVQTWYMPTAVTPTGITSNNRLGGDFDWKADEYNWHARFMERLYEAKGIIVVVSAEARRSLDTIGRGMWRERVAVDFFRDDNPVRVREIENSLHRPEAEIPRSLLIEMVSWGRSVLELPPVSRDKMSPQVAQSFNRQIRIKGGIRPGGPNTKVTEWCNIVRRDLYDIQWVCRRCSLVSDTYNMYEEEPPIVCPRCGYDGHPESDE